MKTNLNSVTYLDGDELESASKKKVFFNFHKDGRIRDSEYRANQQSGAGVLNKLEYTYDEKGRERSILSATDSLLPDTATVRTESDYSRPVELVQGTCGRDLPANREWMADYDLEGNVTKLLGTNMAGQADRDNPQKHGLNAFQVIDQIPAEHLTPTGDYILSFDLNLGNLQANKQYRINFGKINAEVTGGGEVGGGGGTHTTYSFVPISQIPLSQYKQGKLQVSLPEQTFIRDYAIRFEIADVGSETWETIPLSNLNNYRWGYVRDQQKFLWNSANELVKVEIDTIHATTNTNVERSARDVSFQYDPFGKLIQSRTLTYVNGRDSANERTVDLRHFVVDEGGGRLLTFQTIRERQPDGNWYTNLDRQLVGTTMSDEGGQALAVQLFQPSNTNSNGTSGGSASRHRWVYRDQYGVARYVSNASPNGFDKIGYLYNGQPIGGTLGTSEYSLQDLMDFFPGFQYDSASRLSWSRDGRVFSSVTGGSGSYLNENQAGIVSGAINLYQRSLISPVGDLNPGNYGINYFAEQTYHDVAWRVGLGYAQTAFGGLQVVGGVLAAPATFGASLFVAAKGLDEMVTGVRNMYSETGHVRSMTYQIVERASLQLGASSETAGWIAWGTDFGANLVSPGTIPAVAARAARATQGLALATNWVKGMAATSSSPLHWARANIHVNVEQSRYALSSLGLGGVNISIKIGKAPSSAAGRMNPRDIRFTQDTVSPNFSDGGTLSDVVNQLRRGQLSADDFPTIRVVEHNGKLYSLDNRRLTAFKAAQLDDIPVQRLDLADPAVKAEFLKKFKPINDGLNNVVVPKVGRADARRILREFGKYDSN
ncbi:MAG: hypothetical protein ABL888_12070 [Pirellulaceae bacterium]